MPNVDQCANGVRNIATSITDSRVDAANWPVRAREARAREPREKHVKCVQRVRPVITREAREAREPVRARERSHVLHATFAAGGPPGPDTYIGKELSDLENVADSPDHSGPRWSSSTGLKVAIAREQS